jgi:hypothetical protein
MSHPAGYLGSRESVGREMGLGGWTWGCWVSIIGGFWWVDGIWVSGSRNWGWIWGVYTLGWLGGEFVVTPEVTSECNLGWVGLCSERWEFGVSLEIMGEDNWGLAGTLVMEIGGETCGAGVFIIWGEWGVSGEWCEFVVNLGVLDENENCERTESLVRGEN